MFKLWVFCKGASLPRLSRLIKLVPGSLRVVWSISFVLPLPALDGLHPASPVSGYIGLDDGNRPRWRLQPQFDLKSDGGLAWFSWTQFDAAWPQRGSVLLSTDYLQTYVLTLWGPLQSC